MGKWVKSLLNAASLKTMAGGASGGATGLLAGRLSAGLPPWPKKKLKQWAADKACVKWGWHGHRSLLLAVRLPEDERSLRSALSEIEAELGGLLSEDTGRACGFGYVPLPLRPGGRIADQDLMEGLLEAAALALQSLGGGDRDGAETAAKTAPKESETKSVDVWSAEASGLTVGSLATTVAAMPPATPVSAAAEWFEDHPDCHSIVVVVGGQPCGLITRERLNRMLASKFGMPLYWNRTIDKIMENAPLVAEADRQVEAVARLAMDRPDSQLYDTVIVTEQGRYRGGVTIKSLLESFATLQAEAARRVNPLTGLPGGDIIRREIETRIRLGRPFCVYYADLDYFKWFNDSYGYSAGDDMIRYTAGVLGAVLDQQEGEGHFLGHIGGDDFISIGEGADPESRCREFIERFHAGVDLMYGGVRPTSVLGRHGEPVPQPGVTLSIAVICWDGSRTVSHEGLSRLAAAYKKKAKGIPGSAYAISGAFETSFEVQA
ncbi:GGDEF domain-containing protein [Cohnella sp. 56]|uniref:GGDEF domain-containing protein n=1 Tax=Cohnella sp. 56 TaxID=3113722 RepID=UPI0030EAE190